MVPEPIHACAYPARFTRRCGVRRVNVGFAVAWLIASSLVAVPLVAQAQTAEIFSKTIIYAWPGGETYIYIAPSGHVYLTNLWKGRPKPDGGIEYTLGKTNHYKVDVTADVVQSVVSKAAWSGHTLILQSTHSYINRRRPNKLPPLTNSYR